MPIPSTIADLSPTAGSNSPAGGESPTEGDNHIRALAAITRQVYDAAALSITTGYLTVNGSTVPANGVYLPAANTVGIASNTTLRWSVNSTGNHVVPAVGSGDTFSISPPTAGGGAALVSTAALGGATIYTYLNNTSNTASSASAYIANVGGTSAGDAFLGLRISGAANWSIGPRTSDSGTLYVSPGSTLATTPILKITTAGNVTIAAPSSGVGLAVTGVANTAAVSASTGISVGNAANSSATVLDWYEEGTFTPGVSFGGGTTGITYSAQRAGQFTRIGRVVHFAIRVLLTNKGSSTGAAAFTGLPYADSGTSNALGVFKVVAASGTMTGLTGAMAGIGGSGATTISIIQSGATGDGNVTDANFTNTSDIYVSGSYTTST